MVTEISFENGVPMVPNVSPVILLCGSDYNMGYQYFQQLDQIFGHWTLEKLQRSFTKEVGAELKSYDENLKEHAPEFIDMFKVNVSGDCSIFFTEC